MNTLAYGKPSDYTLYQSDLSENLMYPLQFYIIAFESMFGRHDLRIDRLHRYVSTFHVTEERLLRWHRVFGVDPSRQIPFTYVTTSGTMVLLRILSDLGVNFKFLRHTKNELYFKQPIKPNAVYSYFTEITEIIPVREDRVVLEMSTVIQDVYEQCICIQKDYWLILKLPAETIKRATAMFNLPAHRGYQFQTLRERNPALETAPAVHLHIPKDRGMQYGKVSGDLNPLHLTNLMAKLFGLERPFIQGFCTVNYAIRHFTLISGCAPRELSTTFVRPIFAGQTVDLSYNADAFEICDANGKLLAYGNWNCSH